MALNSTPLTEPGVVYTQPWVVDLILDLVGFQPDQPLFDRLLIEPSAGDGAFLTRVVDRLIESCSRHGVPIARCAQSLAAFELSAETADRARTTIRGRLMDRGVEAELAAGLAQNWIRSADYLLDSWAFVEQADFVVGNPPYIRLEDLAGGGAEYRGLYRTMVGRADIYVAFYEAAIRHLKPGGVLGFICADRWMFNQYGAALRSFVTQHCAVETIIQMHHADAFRTEVSAYPAVSVLRRGEPGATVVASLEPGAESMGGSELARHLKSARETETTLRFGGLHASRIQPWFKGQEPWPLMGPERLALLKRLEQTFPTLEQTDVVVGIGVATGADKVFITRDSELVETDRLLPLAMAADVRGAQLKWSGHYLVNPWNCKGLVDLDDYPRLRQFFDQHMDQLVRRHVGRKQPANWYRTIDRVNNELTAMPKLYLPDFKGRIGPVLDSGGTYPHHNLYFIASRAWDLEVLGGLLLSDVAQFFIEAYGVRMRGGYLRFQAQYLRRIRVPNQGAFTPEQIEGLRTAFRDRDVPRANKLAAELYALTPDEVAVLGH